MFVEEISDKDYYKKYTTIYTKYTKNPLNLNNNNKNPNQKF